jgi:VIT1/CCC1 family predicted Fe2+/Mn2+ transporter
MNDSSLKQSPGAFIRAIITGFAFLLGVLATVAMLIIMSRFLDSDKASSLWVFAIAGVVGCSTALGIRQVLIDFCRRIGTR